MNRIKYISDDFHIAGIMDIFEAFLSIDHPVVFAHAALNSIMCLIKYIKGSMEQKEIEELVDFREMFHSNGGMSESALGYVVRCHSILAKMYLMPVCPIFWGAEKIKTGSQPVTVQTEIPDLQVTAILIFFFFQMLLMIIVF